MGKSSVTSSKKNKPSLDPSRSPTSDAHSSKKECEYQKVFALYPVRFALSDDALVKIPKGGFEAGKLPPAAGIKDHPNHDLRRLRQGYVYILTNSVGPDEESSDKGGIWHIFQYTTHKDDLNAASEVDWRKGLSFSFNRYTWPDKKNFTSSDWVLGESQKYIPLSRTVTKCWIAYSDLRWSQGLFNKIQTEAEARNAFMQEVSIDPYKKGFESTYIAPIEQLKELVEDYKNEKTADEVTSNVYRGTGVGHDYSDTMTPKKVLTPGKDKKEEKFLPANVWTGAVVAVHDTIGELLDVASLQKCYFDKTQQCLRKYEYPVQTALNVTLLEPLIHKELYEQDDIGSWVRSHIFPDRKNAIENKNVITEMDDESKQKFLEQMEIEESAITGKRMVDVFAQAPIVSEKRLAHIINVQQYLGSSADRADLFNRQRALQQYSEKNTFRNQHWADEYLSFIATCMQDGMNLSAAGIKALIANLAPVFGYTPEKKEEPKKEDITQIINKEIAGITRKLFNKYATSAKDGFKADLEYFDRYVKIIANSVVWLSGKTSAGIQSSAKVSFQAAVASCKIMKQLMKIYGVDIPDFSVDMPKDKLQAFFKTMFSNIEKRVNLRPSTEFSAKFRNNTARAATATGAGSTIKGGAIVLSGWLVVCTMVSTRKDQGPSASSVDRCMPVFAFLQTAGSFVEDINLISKVDLSNVKIFNLEKVVGKNITATAGKAGKYLGFSAAKVSIFSTVGIALSLVKAADGFRTEDDAVLFSNLTSAFGSGCIMLSSTLFAPLSLVGFVLIIAGAGFNLFKKTQAEKWLYYSFWGHSKEYWGDYDDGEGLFNGEDPWTNKRLDPLALQFETALDLHLTPGLPRAPIYVPAKNLARHEIAEAGYKIEMARFNDLVEQIMAVPESPGTGAVVIHWSGIKTEADIKKLNITPQFYSKNISKHPDYGPGRKGIFFLKATNNPEIQDIVTFGSPKFLREGQAELKLNHYDAVKAQQYLYRDDGHHGFNRGYSSRDYLKILFSEILIRLTIKVPYSYSGGEHPSYQEVAFKEL